MDLKFRKRNNINHKKIFLTICILLLTGLTLGFAYLEARLNIKGIVTVANGRWNVHFENLSVDSGSIKASSPATISADGRKITFAVMLKNDDDYYQFETDIVNSGQLDAMVSDAKISGLPASLKPFIEYTLTYADDEEIKDNDALPVGSTERIKVRLNFNKSANLNNLPIEETFELVLDIPYIQATEEAVDRHPKGPSVLQTLKEKNNWVPDAAISWTDTGAAGASGHYYITETHDDEYPIYFYRGGVTDNNIIFADICWKIVRTTDTGGVKLIYNGKPTSAGACPEKLTPYTITGVSGDTSDEYSSYYMYNGKDSKMKEIMDDFYVGYIIEKGYDGYLEDTVWCNDLSYGEVNGYGAYDRLINASKPAIIYDQACPNKEDRYTVSDTTKGNGKLTYPIGLLTADEMALGGMGNVGYSSSSYLYGRAVNVSIQNNSSTSRAFTTGFWTMTPGIYDSNLNYHFSWYLKGNKILSNSPYAMNPSVSLSSEVFIESGDGTVSSPYVATVSQVSSDATSAKTVDILGNAQSAYLDNVSSQFVKSSGGIDFSQISSNSNGRGLYIKAETIGTEYPIYYYRGNVTDNNVIFAGFCWKIVRTTESGGTKMIYNGIPVEGNCGNSGTSSRLATKSQPWNTYATLYNSSVSSSPVKKAIDSWYSTNLTSYTSKIEDAVWCSDNNAVSTYYQPGNYYTFYSETHYTSIETLQSAKIPIIRDNEVCPRPEDRQTIKTGNNKNGNKLLDYPIGMLTADEVMLAGAVSDANNTTYYLYTGEEYLTMTPYYISSNYIRTTSSQASTSGQRTVVVIVNSNGQLASGTSSINSCRTDTTGTSKCTPSEYTFGVRPAIVLAAGAKSIVGDGTAANPYIVG